MVSWFVKNLRTNYFNTINKILRYLNCNLDKDITLEKK